MKITTDNRRLARDVAGVNRALSRWASVSGKDITVEVQHSGRRVAANLAYRTQPFGNSSTQQAVGQTAVRRDIYRVFATPGMLFEQVEEKSNGGLAGYFYKLCRERKIGPVRKLLASLGISLDIGQTPKRQHHKSARNGRGRVPAGSAPRQLVLGGKNGDALERYVTKIQKRVGWAAAGWSACALALGSTRGIVKWKKRGRKGPGTVVRRGGSQRPTVHLINSAPYISTILPPGEREKAVRREEQTLEKQCRAVLAKQARRQGFKVRRAA